MSPARLGALWFGIQAVWSAVLGVVLQTRSEELDPAHGVTTYATVATAGAAVATVTQLLAGRGSDGVARRTGSRLVFYHAGIALALVALLALFAAPSPALLVATFVALQVGMNVANGPYQAAVPDHVADAHEGLAAAWMGGLSSAGAVTGLLVAATTRGMATAVILAALLLLSYAITVRHVAALPRIALGRAEPLRVSRDVRTLLASRGAVFLGFYTLFGFLFFFVRETLGIADARTTTGVLFLGFTLAGIAGAALAARPADTRDKRVVVTVAGIAIGAGVAAFALAPSFAVALGAAIVAGAAWGAFATADWAIAFAVLPRTAMATAMGLWNLALTIPQVVAPLVTAPLVAALDARAPGSGPRGALALVVVEFALGTAWLWRLPRLGPRAATYGASRSRRQPSTERR